MALLSVREAASRLGVDERTVRRWIERGTLTASTGVSGRARIDEGEVARLQARLAEEETTKKQAQPDIATLLAQIGMMESKIDDLESKVDDLSGQIEDLESEIRAGPRGKHIAPPRPRPAPLQPALLPDLAETTQGQPEGTITLAQLAASLGVDQSTIKEHLAKGHYEDTPVPHGKLNKHYFTPEQAEQARRYHAEHPPRGQR